MRRTHLGKQCIVPAVKLYSKVLNNLPEVLNLMSVHPKHRRQGIGRLLMQWGLDKASELGLESWMEASEGWKLLYETLGFRVVIKITADTSRVNPSDEWKRLEHDLSPLNIWIMWRPPGGQWEEGRRILPWDLPSA